MASKGFEELKRVFGADAVTEKEGIYLIYFPLPETPSHDGYGYKADEDYRASLDDHPFQDKDDHGSMLNRDANKIPPHKEAFDKLARMLSKGRKGVELGISQRVDEGNDEAIVQITKQAAEQAHFIKALQNLADGHFHSLTDGTAQFRSADYDKNDGAVKETKSQMDAQAMEPADNRPLTQRVLEKLNGLREGTQWQIGKDVTLGKVVFTTQTPIANATGVLFAIAKALNLPEPPLPADATPIPASIPLELITEENIGKMDMLNPVRLAKMLEPKVQRG